MRKFRNPWDQSPGARNNAALRLRAKIAKGQALTDTERRWAEVYDENFAKKKLLVAEREATESSAGAGELAREPVSHDIEPDPPEEAPATTEAPEMLETDPPDPPDHYRIELTDSGESSPAGKAPTYPPPAGESSPPRVYSPQELRELMEKEESGEGVDQPEDLTESIAQIPREELAEFLVEAYEEWMLEQHELARAAGVRGVPKLLIRGLMVPCAKAALIRYLPDDLGAASLPVVVAGSFWQWKAGRKASSALQASGKLEEVFEEMEERTGIDRKQLEAADAA